ncbi:hypothetical protein [Rugamonas apoptosis]|uniref:PEP-CTERM protein-sorting domain-containing protein n=1 Tax=Rugamonas apoptosis TaxID=2758570 RepID=A0A7W2FAC2_9BURK|nr:hypothetical protein [Rugamonas apoptosis]MBA5688078.1 hypothetical protein [Rugamonas apoptosis]
MKIRLSILLAMLLTGAGGAVQAAAVPVVTLDAPQCHASLTAAPCRIGGAPYGLAPAASHPGDSLDGAFAQPGDDLQALDDYAPSPASVQAPAADAAPVPEPAQFLMLLAGVILLGLSSTRQEKYDKFSA